jgi:hypothetical protein
MNDDIEKARAAHAALIAAKAACDAAGLTITCGELFPRDDKADAVGWCTKIAGERLASAERRSQPIARGDAVRVLRGTYGGVDTRGWKVLRVGEKRAFLSLGGIEFQFALSDGCRVGSYELIDPDDLARIKRDLVGKRPPKPAADAALVTTATKGESDE